MSMLSQEALSEKGFAALGINVQISEFASIYGAHRIKIGSNVRIDDFSVLAAGEGGIEIGNFVHIAVGASLIGAGKIILSDFSGLSSRVSIYSSSDDYTGSTLTNPTVPDVYKNVQHAPVHLGKHVIVGSGSVILPGVSVGTGAAIGALSLVTKNCEEFWIYAGNPLRKIKMRNRTLLNLEQMISS